MQNTITTPPADEMMRRLKAIDDAPHMDVLYRILTNSADRELVPMGVVMAMSLAMADYTAGYPTALTAAVSIRMHQFVPAFTDDPQVQEEILDLFRDCGMHDGRD